MARKKEQNELRIKSQISSPSCGLVINQVFCFFYIIFNYSKISWNTQRNDKLNNNMNYLQLFTFIFGLTSTGMPVV